MAHPRRSRNARCRAAAAIATVLASTYALTAAAQWQQLPPSSETAGAGVLSPPPVAPPPWSHPTRFGDRAERPPRTDPLLPVGIVATSIGVTLASFGVLWAVDGDGETSVPFLLAGGLTAGTGITMIGVGVEPVTGARRSENLVLGGGILASAGSTAIGFGAAWQNAGALGGGLLVGGGSAAAAGLVMMVIGAQDADEERPPVTRGWSWPSAPNARVPRSPGRATVGKVLVGVGLGVAGVGATVTAAEWEESDGWVLLVSGPIMGTGALLTAIGIPLWATGAALVPAEELEEDTSLRRPRATAREIAPPDLAIGPGSVTARWRF